MRNMSASPPEANVNSNVSLKIKRNVLLRDAQKESAQLPVLDVRNTVTGMSRRLAKSCLVLHMSAMDAMIGAIALL